MKKSFLFVLLGLMGSIAPLQSGKPAKKVATVGVASKVLKGGGGSNGNDSGNTPTQSQPALAPAPMPAPPAVDAFSSPATSRAGDPKKGAKVVPKKQADRFFEGFGKGFSDGYSKGFSDGRKTPQSQPAPAPAKKSLATLATAPTA